MTGFHEPSVGESDEWYTPPAIFAALRLTFALDPCHPGPDQRHCVVPSLRAYTVHADGLAQQWVGRVFMNPPFGARNAHVPWLRKFIEHGDGIAIVRAYTSAAWFQEWVPQADAVLFPRGKTQFVRPDGTVGKAPGHGVALLAMGQPCVAALRISGLGWCP